MANLLDNLIGYWSPRAAVRRLQAREVLAHYEAADASRLRKSRTAKESANMAVARGARTLREQARYLEQNHDLARGILNELVLKTVGPTGITCEPQPRTAAGDIHDELAEQLAALFKDWSKRPEVTWQHDWPSAQRLLARSWVRDGEVFAQTLLGTVPYLDHGTTVPLSLELLEADMVPLDYNRPPRVLQGIEVSTWGRPEKYSVYLSPPGEMASGLVAANLKQIPAARMLHCKLVDRIRQLRGVSVFASILTRLDDLKDYEESERIAAKVAASMAAVIKKGLPDDYEPVKGGEPRELKFRPGMIFDDLRPGEDVATIDTKRPNANLLTYRQGQLRGAASGTGTSFSSVAKDYNGTYSAQRQELVESWASYATLQAEFTAQVVRPAYESFVAMAIASGLVKVPADVVPASVDDAIYIGPQMPWIDPKSEADANIAAQGAGYDSGPSIIRRRGLSPRDVLAQEAAWRRQVARAGLSFSTTTQTAPSAPAQEGMQ